MIKLSKTNINPPDGRGNVINALDISYYDTNTKDRKEHRMLFALGQYWSRGDGHTFRIDKFTMYLNQKKDLGLRANLKSIDTPQQLETNLITLINFWQQLDPVLKSDIIGPDKRFEVLD